MRVLHDITNNYGMQTKLYETAADFWDENVHYRTLSDQDVKSNLVKKYLHDILTYAIFHYCPCKDLQIAFHLKYKPKKEKWQTAENKWLSLSAEPFQHVSKFCSIKYGSCFMN